MDLSTITISQFKARFNRDFQYQNVPDAALNSIPDPDFIQDQDITNAFADAQVSLNQALLPDDPTITIAYLYLTAHCLCVNIQAANGGINNPAAMPVNARNVGSVSESYTIPEEYTESAQLATYTQTSYGLKYLSIMLPYLVGNFGAVCAVTNP